MAEATTGWRVVVACALAAAPGCASKGGDASVDAARPRDPQANCVKPGSLGNALGVGAYCTPDGPACPSEAGFLLCSAGVANVPDDAWFCTRPCAIDGDCGGEGARCIHDPVRGTGCVPRPCLPPSAGDAGVDGTP